MHDFLSVLGCYATFAGRARRREFWMYALTWAVVWGLMHALDAALFAGQPFGRHGVFALLFTLATLLPSAAVTVRRLHDTGRCGWWALLIAPPLVFAVVAGAWGQNAYGPDPKGRGRF